MSVVSGTPHIHSKSLDVLIIKELVNFHDIIVRHIFCITDKIHFKYVLSKTRTWGGTDKNKLNTQPRILSVQNEYRQFKMNIVSSK